MKIVNIIEKILICVFSALVGAQIASIMMTGDVWVSGNRGITYCCIVGVVMYFVHGIIEAMHTWD